MVLLPAFLDGLARTVSTKKGKKLSEDEDGGREIAKSMIKDSKKNSTLLGTSGFVSSESSKRFTSICSNRGEKGINQDRAIVWEGFGCQEDITFCGMFDGHGPWGHVIAKRVKKSFPSSLLCQWQQTLASLSSSPECSSPFDLWKQACLKTFSIIDLDLKISPSIDSYCSGCTALTAVLQGDHLVIANAGDSRAVIATTSDDGNGLVPVQLSVDFKPNIPEEAERIKQSDGRLFCLDDEPGVYRVGMPNGGSLGLAVSRAFGDYCLKDFGLVSEPEVTYRKITDKDQFLILATDGMWDVMTNNEAVEIVRGVKERRKSAKRLVERAVTLWRRKRKATSNICTAQALLANMAAMYAVYHGPAGLKSIAQRVHGLAGIFSLGLNKLGVAEVQELPFFDTVKIKCSDAHAIADAASKSEINLRVVDSTTITASFDETTTLDDVDKLFKVFASGKPVPFTAESLAPEVQNSIPSSLTRESPYLTHPIFNMYHTEHELLRYIHKLQSKDLSLCHSMIPLGSCTMKLNATTEMMPVTWPSFTDIHPFAPVEQAQGYQEMFENLGDLLCTITGFDSFSLQPNAGAAGEYAGLMVIRAYHMSRGDHHRNVCIIPVSAHGTNPASAAMCGMKIITVGTDAKGNINIEEVRKAAEANKDNLAALMVTYPSTHGVYEEGIDEICNIIHENGGQVYMDGANMNAQVGLTSPGFIGADVCHLNLHKTFCIPHGGGGPGMGPIGVKNHLAPFLPSHPVIPTGGIPQPEKTAPLGAISAAPWGSALILPISYTYIAMMGSGGLTDASKIAILNANYMAKRLEKHYPVLFRGVNGTVAHEFIIDLRGFKNTAGIEPEDVAKRLMDYGFHGPTMSWPVPGTLMIEPTESESKAELDRFCDALISIREEIAQIEKGNADVQNNVLKGAPHPPSLLMADTWKKPYSREYAAFPAPWLRSSKFWPTTGRVDNVYGDRKLVCTLLPEEEQVAAAVSA